MGKFRIGIIGLGGVAQAHLQAIDMLDDVVITSVCDIREDAAKAVADKYGATAWCNYQELLAAGEMDLVLVLTPAATHREIVEAVAAANFHALCEKPLALTLEDGESMVAACEKAGVKLFYGSSYRYLPAVKKAFELIHEGKIGEVQLLTEQLVGGNGLANYRELSPVHCPLGGPGGPGMGIIDHGIHLVDIFAWFTGSEIIKVEGQGLISGGPAGSEFMVMHFANGAIGHLLYNAATYSTLLPNEGMFSGGQGWLTDGTVANAGLWEMEPGSISVYGTTGSLRIFHYTNALFINTGDGPRRVELSGRPAFGHFATQLEECMASIFENRRPLVSGKDGVRALSAILSTYKQMID